MPAPPRPHFPTGHPNLLVQRTDDGSRTLSRIDDEETYHSSSGALRETQHVYLQNSGVAERLHEGLPSAVLEVGLGTGMAMLATVDAALAGNTPLQYVALEHDWLSSELLQALEPERWVENHSLAERFIAWRSSLGEGVPPGTYQWDIDLQRQLTVVVGDAQRWQGCAKDRFHAVYFDPFAPAKHPQLWTVEVFREMARVLRPEGKLTTYCVSRAVREAMQEAGLLVERTPGPPGGKRNALVARRCLTC